MSRRIVALLCLLALLAVGIFPAQAQEPVTITIRCKASPPTEEWRCNNFLDVVEQVEADLGVDIELTLIQDNEDWGPYKQEFVLASEAGEAPDIVVSGHEDIGAWAEAGLIAPLDEMIREGDSFTGNLADVVPSLWESAQFADGQIYGVPQDAEARPLYYSKILLADLGWSEEEIESLDERIASGEFTFDDMIETAAQAVEEGVVEEGNGYWHRNANGPDFAYFYYAEGGEIVDADGNLVFDTEAALAVLQRFQTMREVGVMTTNHLGIEGSVWHTTLSSGENVVFWTGGTWNWGDWAVNYVADRGGQDYLFENIGFALVPSMGTGTPITLTHPLMYMVSSQSEHPEVALALIDAVTTPELNNRHAVDSAHLGILNAQLESEEYQNAPFLAATHPMLEYTTFIPNHPSWGVWSESFWTGIQAVESGELSAEDALNVVVEQLQNQLGDGITVR